MWIIRPDKLGDFCPFLLISGNSLCLPLVSEEHAAAIVGVLGH